MGESNIPGNPAEGGLQWEDADNRTFTETIFFPDLTVFEDHIGRDRPLHP